MSRDRLPHEKYMDESAQIVHGNVIVVKFCALRSNDKIKLIHYLNAGLTLFFREGGRCVMCIRVINSPHATVYIVLNGSTFPFNNLG